MRLGHACTGMKWDGAKTWERSEWVWVREGVFERDKERARKRGCVREKVEFALR